MRETQRTGVDAMNAMKHWWKGLFAKKDDRRRSDRVLTPKLAVYYWTGSKPVQHEVRDISPTGLYVVTEERWYPGTIVKMTLQRTGGGVESSDQHVSVESRAVRWGEDGVGLQFILLDSAKPASKSRVLNEVMDKKSMEKFLRPFLKKPE
jgi:hypothetical protein